MADIYFNIRNRMGDIINRIEGIKELNLKMYSKEMQAISQEIFNMRDVYKMYEQKLNKAEIETEDKYLIHVMDLIELLENFCALIVANYDAFTRLNNDPQIVSKVMKILYGRAG